MPFQLSPGVNVSEIDLTGVVPAVATTDGALAGIFRWGPIAERVLVDSETLYANRFGKPSNLNAETWHVGASFLSYANRLFVSRAANTTGATPALAVHSLTIDNVVTPTNNSINVSSLGISAGMYVLFSENTAIMPYGEHVTVASVNSTSVTLSQNVTSNVALTLHFGHPQTTYSALAVDTGGIVDNVVNQIVKNQSDYTTKDGNFDPDVLYVAKYPGALGNSLRVAVADNAASFNSTLDFTPGATTGNCVSSFTTVIGNTVGTFVVTPGIGGTVSQANTIARAFASDLTVGDQVRVGNASIGIQYMQVKTVGSVATNSSAATFAVTFEDPYRLHTAFASTTGVDRFWEFFNVVDQPPGQSDYVAAQGNSAASDEVHVVVVDDGGQFTGTPGTILEVFKGLSRATDAKNNDNTGNYYKDVINLTSAYIWFANDRAIAPSANAARIASSSAPAPGNYSFLFGSDGFDEANTSAFSVIAGAYDLFASSEDVDISLILQGKPLGGETSISGITVDGFQLANYIIDNICEIRKDCIALISPPSSLVLNAFGTQATNLVAWRNALHSSSYAVLDSGYKYMYDRYNDVYRWVPLNGDIAGLCVRTDSTNDAWWSPAGFNRGQIKNLVKLAFNPRQSERDILFKNGINPVVTFPGQGTVLYGDKTLQAKPSAFDHINVRRLFIVLEKAIATAAKYSLFEFNDSFTRAQFKNLITPYLRMIQGRRGITDFLVVCDDTNNTPAIINGNQFVGDIYIKPARSINFIQLNFVAVNDGVQFSEVVNKF